jgi:hypothetical protein
MIQRSKWQNQGVRLIKTKKTENSPQPIFLNNDREDNLCTKRRLEMVETGKKTQAQNTLLQPLGFE